jgi:hypothetical protein
MKFDCGETWLEKRTRLSDWHRWIAWFPVRVGPHDCRWLEHVERKGEWSCGGGDCYWDWEYREATDEGS